MKLLLDRISLAFIAVTSAYVGIFAYFAPRTWFDTFPGFGLRWLPQLGPYNEHFAKDVGAAYLAFTALSLMALAHTRKQAVVPLAGAALLVFNTLHFVYHLTMLHMYAPLDRALNVVLLGLLVVMSVILVIPAGAVTDRRSTSST
ncbi:hypothetical protein [Lentzea californiensis]|uniref:hypothetical protein n=1 Tax=Lentzea californiensis TaxID=438851 RepID=UPI002166AF6E|nr:hypothetical protein [Lentzea californiensis]MCR3750082.1 hypothetical protein [Lentzea californiensis]